jgi:putative transposase
MYSVTQIVKMIKSITAREVFKNCPEVKRQLWGGEFWSDGGYIGTVGDGISSEIIKRYIKEQGSEQEKAKVQQLRLFPF